MKTSPPTGKAVIEEIEAEHAFLQSELARIQNKAACRHCSPKGCNDCGPEVSNHCQREIDGYFTKLLAYMQQHFMHEESLMRMRAAPPAVEDSFRQHFEAHADMMSWAVNAVSEPDPCLQGRHLADLIERWLVEHISSHDARLQAWLNSQ